MRKVLLAILMMGILALQAQEHISVLESNPLLQTKQKQMPKMQTAFALSSDKIRLLSSLILVQAGS